MELLAVSTGVAIAYGIGLWVAKARYPETLDEEEGIDGEPDPPWVRVATMLFLALCAVVAILAVAGVLGL